ncbi:hypothetical protein B0H13DRAFT_1890414 [Mycena leptocephala]|nr:hypothetical protein B0H13DRAFT_1890414 [Mycena leptocephala]
MPSGVSLTALTYFDNPHQVGRSKVWFFDASMFLSRDGNKTNGICGAVRYFNGSDLPFDDLGLYVINAFVGLPHDAYDLGSNANKELYDFVGDIQWLIPLHEHVLSDVAGENPDVRFPHIETEYPPYVVISGLPFNIQKPSATFNIDIEQYTQIAKGSQMMVFPASCTIINSPRWSKVPKPVPFPEKYITTSGYLAVASSSSKCKEFDSTPSWVKAKNKAKRTIEGDAPSSSPGGSR